MDDDNTVTISNEDLFDHLRRQEENGDVPDFDVEQYLNQVGIQSDPASQNEIDNAGTTTTSPLGVGLGSFPNPMTTPPATTEFFQKNITP